MITNCELPLPLLQKENLNLNDFDFVLFHLFKESQSYKEYYMEMRSFHPERLMIFDNSAYEFFVKGETLDLQGFYDAIVELQPDYYILPDVLQDRRATIKGISDFQKKFGLKIGKSKPMAVAQGNSSADLEECLLLFQDMDIEYVGIPFHLPFYKDMHVEDDILNDFGTIYMNTEFNYSEDFRYATGRVQWVRNHKALLSKFDKVHMLGSHCPLEKVYYKDYFSMDTGYPVKLGLGLTKLGDENHKPTSIIDDFLQIQLSEEQEKMICDNVLIFKQL